MKLDAAVRRSTDADLLRACSKCGWAEPRRELMHYDCSHSGWVVLCPQSAEDICGYLPVHRMEWVWLVMVPPLMVPHINGDGCVKGGEKVVRTCEKRREQS